MQARLKVTRAHEAAVKALPYWQKELDEAFAKREAIVDKHSAELLKEKTWCGGFKYNEQSARKYILIEAYWIWQKAIGLWDVERSIERHQNIVNWLTKFIQITTDKQGFMVILTDEEYGWIWLNV